MKLIIYNFFLLFFLSTLCYAEHEESLCIIKGTESRQHGIIIENTNNTIKIATVNFIFKGENPQEECVAYFPKFNIEIKGRKILTKNGIAVCTFDNVNHKELQKIKLATNQDGDLFAFQYQDMKFEKSKNPTINIVPCKVAKTTESLYLNVYTKEHLIEGGGVVFNLKKEVVGIAAYEIKDTDIGYPISQIIPFNKIEELIEKK